MSDIHGNLPALELVLSINQTVDTFISLGDVVNYGPWSNECVELLETINSKILLIGNHEINFINNYYPGENIIAKAFHDHCIKSFNNYDKIKTYIPEYYFDNYLLKHTINDKIIFSDTELTISQNTIIGHSHKQYISTKGNYKLINPGSVGQNRQYINLISYILWDTDKNEFQFKNITYDVNYVISKLEGMNYPEICINYYKNKKRI